jgi:hypothetical protein
VGKFRVIKGDEMGEACIEGKGVRNGNILFGTYKKETKLGPPGREWEGAYY